jgi:prolyl oligopeptidase
VTTELVVACFHLAGSVAMFFKHRFNRVRPWVLAPELTPPIPLPGHPAYPSGHSTQMYLMARVLAHLVPRSGARLETVADNVAVNRERAGLHYASDTEAGKFLAERIFEILTHDCDRFTSALATAQRDEWRRPAARSLAGPIANSLAEVVAQLEKETLASLHRGPYGDIRARAAHLTPPRSPMPCQFPGGEVAVRAGSLYVGDTFVVEVDSRQGDVVDFRLSPDSQKVAYGLQTGGSDAVRWLVRDVTTRAILSGEPVTVRLGTVYWDRASNGFYYSSPPSAKEEETGTRGRRIRYRSIKPDVAKNPLSDPVIFENPEWPNYADYGLCELEGGGRLAYRVQGSAEIPLAAYLCDAAGNATPTCLYASSEDRLGRFVTVDGNEAFFRTSICEGQGANNFAIEAVELVPPFRKRAVVRADDDNVLINAQRIGSFLVLHYITPELTNDIRFATLDGHVVSTWRPDAELREDGTVSPFSGNDRSTQAYFTYEGIATPPQLLKVSLSLDGAPKVDRVSSAAIAFDAKRVKHEPEYYASTDGERIPIRLMSRRDVQNPRFVYLYYYGAIGAATLPTWNTTFQMVLDLGGVVAIANIRGGGEFGVAWQAPVKLDRRQTLDDIAEAARWLKNRYPVPLVSSGRSYGGMHTLASLARSAKDVDLFVAEMPVGDVLGFLENGEFGRSAWDDFGFAHSAAGDLRRTPQELEILKKWAPTTTAFELPKPLLIVTAANDDRVEPSQAHEMAMALHRPDSKLVFLRTVPDGGHAAATAADVLTFIAGNLRIELSDPL